MTYPASTISYWVGQANDTSTGRHPTGWTNGQRWLETAPEWMAMYDSMTTDRDTWQGRANQAWGTSRQWNSGSSFEADLAAMTADRNTWTSRANNAYGPARQWNVAPSFEDQAWTGSGYGSGVLWSDAAHDDPNVWTNRYNAGYNQATTDKQPAALYNYAQSLNNLTLNTSDSTFVSLSLPYSGYWHFGFNVHLGDGADGQWGYFELRNGGSVLDACMCRFRYSGVEAYTGGFFVGQFNAGNVISIIGHAGGWAGPITNLRCAFTFVPTPAQPH